MTEIVIRQHEQDGHKEGPTVVISSSSSLLLFLFLPKGCLRGAACKDQAKLEIGPKIKILKLCQNKASYMPDSLA